MNKLNIYIYPLFLRASLLGFPGSSVGKEFCNTGDPGSIPGSGRSAEGIDYPLQFSFSFFFPLQFSWGSLVTQLVKNLPAMQ